MSAAAYPPHYHYYVQRDLESFWPLHAAPERRVLFVSGLGFDPRCVPAFRVMSELLPEAEVTTFLGRFTNLQDEHRRENERHAERCLAEIRRLRRSFSRNAAEHHEVEVTLFSTDSSRPELVGDQRLLSEFQECLEEALPGFTDIIVDVSGFPRMMMYVLLSYLWERRPPDQNLFAVLTESSEQVPIHELQFSVPRTMLGTQERRPDRPITWLPVLGGSIERLIEIHESLGPEDVVPIVPFPTEDPRLGDELLLDARKQLLEWEVPFANVLYASSSTPFDVFRKIHDFVVAHEAFGDDLTIVASALSGRSLSLGVLLAALLDNLYVCHTQAITYRIDGADRDRLAASLEHASPTLYWLHGAIYGS